MRVIAETFPLNRAFTGGNTQRVEVENIFQGAVSQNNAGNARLAGANSHLGAK